MNEQLPTKSNSDHNQPTQSKTQTPQPTAPQAQPPAPPKTTWGKNSLKNLLYLASLIGLVSLLFWLVIPTNQPATLAQVTPVATATAGGWEAPITQTVTPTVTPTPMTMMVTVYPTPTEAPTRTPTPTTPTNSDGSATVGGYTFSPPQAVKVQSDITMLEIEGWLSDDTIVDTSNGQILAINIHTGAVTALSPKFENGVGAYLMANHQVVFRKSGTLWFATLDNPTPEPLPLNGIKGTIMIGPDGQEVWLYDAESQQIQIVGQDRQLRMGDAKFIHPLNMPIRHDPGEMGPFGYWTDTHVASGWTALRAWDYTRLVNLHTSEFKDIDLWPDHIQAAYWSPNGQKMALLTGETAYGSSYVKLYVLDIASGQTTEIETEFAYITNVTWAPDSENLLFSANTGKRNFPNEESTYTTATLFLVNIYAKKIQPIPVLPQDSYLSSTRKLSWSPKGDAIMFSGYIPNNTSVLHRIDVTKEGN